MIRYGIIGTGMMGCEHIRNIAALDDVVVSAVADPHPESLRWAQLACGDSAAEVAVYADYRELLEQADVDAVVVAPDLRLGWASTLLKLHNAKQSVACGRKATRYVAHDVHGDTRSMSARAGARLIKTMLMPYREVAPLNR